MKRTLSIFQGYERPLVTVCTDVVADELICTSPGAQTETFEETTDIEW